MKTSSKIVLAFLLVTAAGFYFLLDWIVEDLTPRYRESTEEPLVDFANILAAQLSVSSKDGVIDTQMLRAATDEASLRQIDAQIYAFRKQSIDLRIYVTDHTGTVIFDSENGRDEGKDYSGWRDVSVTLRGEYGARTSRDHPTLPGSIMYVAAPVLADGKIIGSVSVGKPTQNANQLIEAAQQKILNAGLFAFAAVILVGILLSQLVTRPIRLLTDYASAIRDGRKAELPDLGSGEMALLGETFEEMRESLEGRKYVEKYVQTLTHEIKSPLSGIKGAVELLREDLPPERHRQFLENIERETLRLQSLVEKLLNLSALQRKRFMSDAATLPLGEVLSEVISEHQASADAKELRFDLQLNARLLVHAERFWLKEALANLVQNAIDFSARGAAISVRLEENKSEALITIHNSGEKIPEYALDRIFEQFYSLPRPDSGKKSTGLGLTLVKEVMELHGGRAEVSNHSDSGVLAVVRMPVGI